MKFFYFFISNILLSLLYSVSNSATAAEICTAKEIRTEIEIKTSPEKIWNMLVDFSEYPSWHTYLLEVKGIAEEKTKIICTAINTDSSTTTFSAFIHEAIPFKKLSWGGSIGFLFKANHYFILEEVSQNNVRLIQGEYWKGIFGKNYGKKIYLDTYQKFVTMNQRLKFLLES